MSATNNQVHWKASLVRRSTKASGAARSSALASIDGARTRTSTSDSDAIGGASCRATAPAVLYRSAFAPEA
jgi:hypothetical protein